MTRRSMPSDAKAFAASLALILPMLSSAGVEREARAKRLAAASRSTVLSALIALEGKVLSFESGAD